MKKQRNNKRVRHGRPARHPGRHSDAQKTRHSSHARNAGHLSRTSHASHAQRAVKGVIMTTGKGLGFVNDEERPFPEDILIESGNLNTAMNGDAVEVILLGKIGGRLTGKVSKITKRAKTVFVGTMLDVSPSGVFSPDDNRAYFDFHIPKSDLAGAKRGDKAQVRLVKWDASMENPVGAITRVLGPQGEHNVEMESIVLDKGFDTRFPPQVEAEADMIEKTQKVISTDEISRRRDMRSTLTFTIDPVDAKDFDDAISFKRDQDGMYEIGVHIADVSHYVRPDTALDKEALRRGSSVYLVDRTIPMLPEVLSNDVCSLNPNEDKLTFSAVFVMDENGRVHKRWFGRTVINSNKRFTYEGAQKALDSGGSAEYSSELGILNKIAKKLAEEKFRKGAIEFETEEIKFRLDENMRPIGVYKKERGDTHKLVEEFMLLANREVARFIYDSMKKRGGRDTGAIYRIHDVPNKEKIADLGVLVRALGHYFPTTDNITSHDLKAMLKSIEGTPEASLVKTATIRSMSKAIYSTKNIGHFGLSFPFYTHFTSPIRRYPDLLVHRILANHLYVKKFSDKDTARYERIALQSTEREIAAAEAERASIKYKQVEFMKDRTGETFEGIISGITEWGIYIEEANTRCEGMIKLRDLTDDFYELDKKTFSLVGQKTKRRFRLGDKVKFRVLGGDLEKKTLDYALA